MGGYVDGSSEPERQLLFGTLPHQQPDSHGNITLSPQPGGKVIWRFVNGKGFRMPRSFQMPKCGHDQKLLFTRDCAQDCTSASAECTSRTWLMKCICSEAKPILVDGQCLHIDY